MVKRYLVSLDPAEPVLEEISRPSQSRRMNDGNSSRSKRYRATSASDKGRRVFVGNLAWDVSWQDLKDHLRTVGGDVAHVEILRTPDGKSKGCGIATFATAAQALDAVEALSGSELQGRPIFIREDREEETTNNSNVSQQANVSVFVGNLAYETSWQDLKDHMRKAGNVDFVKILSHEDGTSKGCAIVKYQKPPEAARAIRELNNSILDDRSISVREDHEQNHGSNDAVSQLFVGNISYDTTWGELKDLFRTCGDVDHVEVMEFPDGKKKGFATVKFFHTKDAQKAIRQFNGFEFQGRNLEVRFDAHFKSDTPASTRINRDDTVLFVGNLSYETSWKDLKDLFRYCGAVEHVDVMEFPDGRKKGFGTVKFASSAEANAAIEQFNGVEFQGRILEVRWDMKTSRKFEPREKLTLEQGHQRQLFISNLSYDTQWGELKDLFGECGRVERAEILTFPNGKSKGLATVRFVNANDAHAAITRFHGWEFQGRILDVKIDEKA